MRAVFQAIAAILLAWALVLLVADGTAMLAADAFIATPLSAALVNIVPAGDAFLSGAEDGQGAMLWQTTLAFVLSWPGWAVIGGAGFALALLAQPRLRTRSVSIDAY